MTILNRPTFPPNSSIAPGNSPLQGRLHAMSPEDSKPIIESRPLPGTVFDPQGLTVAGQSSIHSAGAQSLAVHALFNPAVPSISALAAALNNDIDAIYQFVANKTGYLATFGSQKGALTTLIDHLGNSFDQSALMVALLRAAGKTANFVFGQLKLTAAQAGAWLGTDPTNIWASRNLLGNGGVPVNVIWDAGTSTYYLTLSHCWVTVDVTGTGSWFVFDPAFKSHTFTAGVDLATITGFNATTFQNSCLSGATVTADYFQNINTANLTSQVNTLNTNLINWINANKPDATLKDLVGGRTIVPVTGTVRNTSLPYQDSSVTPTVWTAIPNSYKTTLQVQYDTINQTFYSEDISSKNLTLFFNSSMQAELRLDGTLLATSTAQGVGTWNSALLTITHPYANTWANQSFWQRVWAGDYYLIAHSWGNSTPDMAIMHQKLLSDNRLAGLTATDPLVLGEALAVLWHNWSAQKTLICTMLGQLNKCSTVLHHQIGMVGQGAAPFTDLGGIVWSTSALDNDYTKVPVTDTAIALRGIGFESNTINQISNASAVSSNNVISQANAAGQKLFFASSANWATVRPQLVNYATADLDNLTNWYINNGWKLLIHQDGNTVQHSYTGYGIYGISPNGGAVGLINGFLHGATGDVVLTVQQNTDNSQLAEVGTGGSGNGAAPNTGGSGSGATPNTILRAEVGPNTEPAIDFNTDQFTGSSIYRHTDLVHGNGQYPLSLPFTRIYNNKDRATVTEAGRGWRHNYMIDITVQNQSYASLSDTTNPLPPLGQFAGIAASGQVVYGMIMILLAPGLSNNPAFAISAISTTEASKLLTSNVAIVRDGDKSYTFTLLSNGTYIPPKGTNLMLTKLTDHFVMQTFDGVRYTFTNWALNKNRISKIEWPSVSGYGNGLVLNFTYGGVGPDFYLTQVSNNQPGSNRALNFTYDLLGGLIPYLKKVTADSSGTLYCNYTFDPALTGHLLSTTDSNGSITSYSYDSKHRLTGYQRPNMANFSVTYDDRDRVVSQSNPKFTLTYLYQVGSTIVNGGPTSISHNFNTDGQPTAIMTGDEITYFNYDGLGRVTQKQLPAGDVINYGYDQYNRVTSETHSPGPGGGLAQNHVYSFAGLAGGASWDKWTSHTDERGQVWNRVYDTAGNLTSQTGPTIGGQTPTKSWTYNQFNQILTATDETGIVTSYTYLPIGDLQSETHDSGTGRLNLTASYTYDTLGNRVTATNPRGFTKSMQYDNLRQLTQVTETAPFSYVTNMTYDTVGNLLTTSKQTGGTPAWQTTTTTYSNTNRPLTVTDPLNNVTTHTWDTWDRHASTTDAENRQRQYQYDANSRLSAIIDANGVTEEQRTYDSAGALATIKDARNNQTTFTRDGFSRVLQTTYPDSSYESFTYDVSGNPLTHRMRSGNTITNTFDILGRLATKSPQGQAVATYAYDLANRQLSVSTPVVTGDPSSGTFSYGYDTAGRMISETNPQSQVISYQLDANGNHTKITYPSGYYATYVYDQLDRLTDIKLNGTTTSAVTFGYDQLSRRTSKNYANGANTSYTYDLGNNLLTMNIAFVGSAANWTYTYNKVHQMLTQNCSDTTYLWRPTVGTVTYAAANNLNQYSTIGGLAATYDNQGGLATYNGWTYTYNTEGMLSTASKTGASASFVYDGSLRQIQKTVGSVKTKYVYSGPHMMEEYDGTAGTLNTRYVFAGAEEPVLQMNSAGTVTYIHHDHHDSVIAQSGSTGAVGNRYNYGPFGESAALSGTTIGYTGQRFDSETGLYHYKARFYLPSIGRFLQADPIGYAAGMNLYAYCSNDGMNHTDPDGNRVVDLNRVRGDLSETTVSRDYFVYRGHGADNAVLGRHVADSKQPGAKRWSQDQVAVDITGRKGFKEAKALVLEVCDGGRNSNEKLNKYIGDKSLGESMAIKTKKNTYAYIGTVTADGHVFIKNDLKPGYSPGVDRPGEQLLFQGGTGKLLERKTVDRIELP